MKKINATIAALFLSTASMTAIAAVNKHAINYDYVQAGFSNIEIIQRITSVDISFVGFGASTSLTDNINLFADVTKDTDNRIDLTISSVGFGYHVPLSDTTDLQTSFAHDKYTVTDSEVTESVTGSTISVGVAKALSDATELSAAYIRSEIDSDSMDGYSVSLVQDMTNELALVGDFKSTSKSGSSLTLNETALSLRHVF